MINFISECKLLLKQLAVLLFIVIGSTITCWALKGDETFLIWEPLMQIAAWALNPAFTFFLFGIFYRMWKSRSLPNAAQLESIAFISLYIYVGVVTVAMTANVAAMFNHDTPYAWILRFCRICERASTLFILFLALAWLLRLFWQKVLAPLFSKFMSSTTAIIITAGVLVIFALIGRGSTYKGNNGGKKQESSWELKKTPASQSGNGSDLTTQDQTPAVPKQNESVPPPGWGQSQFNAMGSNSNSVTFDQSAATGTESGQMK